LEHEQACQDDNGYRNDVWIEGRRDDPQSLDGAQYRNGGRNHPVSVKQGCSEQTDQQQDPPFPGILRFAGPDQCGKGNHATFAFIVRPQNEGEVL
jgi:hypothetical protein